MKVDEIFVKLANSQDNTFDYLQRNRMLFNFFDKTNISKEDKTRVGIALAVNKYIENKKRNQIINIQQSFENEGIKAIFFKGCVLADLIYDNYSCRISGDIDIWVESNQFKSASTILQSIGYIRIDDDEHHLVLKKETYYIELHKHIFNPALGIDESYFINNTIESDFDGVSVKTFSITATIMHLIYHLYMDVFFNYSYYCILSNQQIAAPNLFIFRAYEIACISEKFNESILWEDFICDIKKQKFFYLFKVMIAEIESIFPNVFCSKIRTEINNLKYENNEQEEIVKNFHMTSCDIKRGLCQFIDKNWNYQNNCAVYKKKNFFEIKKPKTLEFVCQCSYNYSETGLSLDFIIADDDFYISEDENYDTFATDGLNFIICGTEEFAYFDIFLFPKINKNMIEIIPYLHMDGKKIEPKFITTKFSFCKSGYKVKVLLQNDFLEKYSLKERIYLGIVISDCSSITKKRSKTYTLAKDVYRWFDPTCFIKIERI